MFQTSFGNCLRTGLCIIEAQVMNDIRIIKRGLPKIYEYTESVDSSNFLFSNKLNKFISNLFTNHTVNSLSLLKIKIISENSVQISYDYSNSYWILSTKKDNCVLFKNKEEVEKLLQNKKIDNLIYEICLNWLNQMESLSKNINLFNDFLIECSTKTLIGFYCGYDDSMIHYEEKCIIFYSFVNNMEKFSQFSAGILEIDFFFQKYGLFLQKSDLCKGNITNQDQFKEEVHNQFTLISSDYVTNQQKGSIFLLINNNKIITTFKILNNELHFLSTLKHSLEKDENFKNNKSLDKLKYKTLIGKYKLPETDDFYLNIIPVISSKLKENKTCLITNKDFQNIFKHTSHPGLTTTIQSIVSKRTLYTVLNQSNDKTKLSTSTSLLSPENKKRFLEGSFKINEVSFRKQCTREQLSVHGSNFNSTNFLYDMNSKSNSRPVSPGKNKTVRFIDSDFKTPLTDIVKIESYKKYYVGDSYENFSFDENDKKKTTCCLVF